MGAELRWILLALSLPMLAGIWWWTARRSRQAPGNAELREPTPSLEPRYVESGDEGMRPHPEPRDWSVSPFEPLNIRTAEFDHVPVLDGPILVNADATPFTLLDEAAAEAVASGATASGAAVLDTAVLDAAVPEAAVPEADSREAAPEPPRAGALTPTPALQTVPAPNRDATDSGPAAANVAERQKIITIRVCPAGEYCWPGTRLMAALETHGLAFGRYQVFHRKHADGRSLFCVASLVEPGTFDVLEMAVQEFRGVTLFAILPGPLAPLDTLDELFATARGLAEELSGMVQDAKGMPLSPQRAAVLREDVARFQASLPRN